MSVAVAEPDVAVSVPLMMLQATSANPKVKSPSASVVAVPTVTPPIVKVTVLETGKTEPLAEIVRPEPVASIAGAGSVQVIVTTPSPGRLPLV